MFALSKLVSVRVQNYRFALSRLAEYSDDSLKFEFSKSPSLMSAFASRARPKLQSLATARIKSTDIMFAPIKVLFDMFASLKFAFLRFASLKLQFYKFDWKKLTSTA